MKAQNILKIKTASLASILVVLLAFAYLFFISTYEIPETNKDLVNFLAGSAFTALIGGVALFLFNFNKDKPNFGESQYENHSSVCQKCGK
jgi:uncharacterized membrane protein YbhN (UPF0104 family)